MRILPAVGLILGMTTVGASALLPRLFEGFDSLLAQSESVAVVTVTGVKEDTGWTMNGGTGEFAVTVEKVMSGSPLPEHLDLLFVYVPMRTPFFKRFDRQPDFLPFRPWNRYVVFLTKKTYRDAKGPRWSNVPTEGSCVQIAPVGDLKEIDSLPVKEALKMLRQRFYEWKSLELESVAFETETLLKQKVKP